MIEEFFRGMGTEDKVGVMILMMLFMAIGGAGVGAWILEVIRRFRK